MAKLNEIVSKFKEELKNGDAWVMFWKEKEGWEGYSFYVKEGQQISYFIKPSLEDIAVKDPKAVIVRGKELNCVGEEINIPLITSFINRCHDTCDYTLVSFLEFYKRKEEKRMAKEEVIEIMENELRFLSRVDDGEFVKTEEIIMVSETMLKIAEFLVKQKE